MQPMKRTSRIVARGFSIVELLVSISIIGLIIGIAFPVISVLTTSSRVEAGLNIVGMASDVARQWVQAEAWANDASTDPSSAVNEEYSGTAAIYCPTGEIRIVVNDRNAKDGSVFLEDQPNEQNGYKDLSKVDYIRIPNGVGIAGVYKDPGSGNVRFIAPPFAIAFNELGQLNYGDTSGYIYYDADTVGGYNTATSGRRPTNYNPFTWRGYDSATNATPMSGSLKKELPFEAIECVSGVVVYSADEFDESGFDFAGGGSVTLASNEGQWLSENGRTIFFSPHTGTALTDEKQD